MAMIFRVAIEVPWSGSDFDGINAARKLLAIAVHDIALAMNAEVSYGETVTNTRATAKGDAP